MHLLQAPPVVDARIIGRRARVAAVGTAMFALSYPLSQTIPAALEVAPYLIHFLTLVVGMHLLTPWIVQVPTRLVLLVIAVGVAGHVWGVVEDHHVVGSIAMFAACAAIGVMATWACPRLSWVAAVLVVAGAADAYSVFAENGVTRNLHEDQDASLEWLQIWMGVAGGGVTPSVGLIDLVYLGFVFGSVRAHRLPARRSVIAIGAATALLFVLSAWTLLPALPFWSVVLLGVYWSYVRADLRATFGRW